MYKLVSRLKLAVGILEQLNTVFASQGTDLGISEGMKASIIIFRGA